MRAREVSDSLVETYLTMSDVLQFRESALDFLRELSSTLLPFSFEKSPAMMRGFMDLIVVLVRMQLLLSVVPDKKLALAMYNRAYFILSGATEGTYPKLAAFVSENEAGPVKRIQDDFAAMSSRVGDTLSTLSLSFSKATTPAVIRKEHVLNPVPKTGSMVDPIVDPFSFELAFTPEFYDWMVFGFLACPNEIIERVEQWRVMLHNGFIATVFGEENLLVHKEFEEQVVARGGKLANLKKVLSEATTQCVAMAGGVHKERRDLLVVELGNMLRVYTDCPGLLGPKIQQVYAALANARMEVEWYYRHLGAAPPKSKAKFREEDYIDDDISFLVHRIDQLTLLVRDHAHVVARYHIEFLAGFDLTQVKRTSEACDKAGWEAGIADIIRQIVDDFGRLNANFVAQGKTYDMAPLRDNLLRCLGYFSLMQRPGATGANHKAELDLFGALSMALVHARNVDQIEEQLVDRASLKQLYFHKDDVMTLFERLVESPGLHPTHTMSFVRLLDSYAENGHPFLTDEAASIGKEAVQLAIRCLRVVMSRIEKLLGAINGLHGFEQLRRQVAPIRAVNLLQKKPGYQAPGYESTVSQRSKLDQFRGFQINLARLCTAVNGAESIVVFDHEFVPKEWVHTLIALSMRKFLNSGMDGLGNILRPSVVEKAVFDYLTALTQVEAHVTIDVNNIVSKALLEQFCDLSLTGLLSEELGQEGGLKASGSSGGGGGGGAGGGGAAGDGEEKKPLYIRKLSDWFIKFVTRTVPSGGIVFSENRRSFISQIGAEFRAEDFVDHAELTSLCSLVGPYGVRAIDHDLLQATANFVRNIKEVLGNNKAALIELSHKYQDEQAAAGILRGIKGLDTAILNAIRVGTCLKLRHLLFDVLSEVTRKRIPLIHSVVSGAYAQYDHPPLMRNVPQSTISQMARVDQAAADAGILKGDVDASFRACVAPLNQLDTDTQLWNLLPYLFAACFTSPLWKEADYHVTVEAHLKNFHTMADAVSALIEIMTSISATRNEGFPPATDFLRAFVQCSSVIILRGSQEKEFASMLIFMDRFLDKCQPLPKAVLDSCLPYTLIRAQYLDLFDKANTVVTVDNNSVDAEFRQGFA
jgi:hypothetical protein